MGVKKSVFLSDSAVNWAEVTTATLGENPKWSEAINAAIDQLRSLIKSAMPDLTQDEWVIIANTYTGCYMPAHRNPVKIASDVMDNLGVIDINKLDVETRGLVEKLYNMSQLEQMAVMYVVQVFLNGDSDVFDVSDLKSKL